MSEFYPDLPDRLKMSFSEIDSDIVVDLRKTDAEYVALYRELAEIKQQHPFIDTILEGEGAIKLSAEEHEVLAQAVQLTRKLESMERSPPEKCFPAFPCLRISLKTFCMIIN